jgi:hypothetical protein
VNTDKLIDCLILPELLSKRTADSNTSEAVNTNARIRTPVNEGKRRPFAAQGSKKPSWISAVVGNESAESSAAGTAIWHVAGGYNSGGGYIASFHAATRSLVSTVNTSAAINQLAGRRDSSLVSVGNDNVVATWNCFDLTASSTRSKMSGMFAVDVLPNDANTIAVGGVGPFIEIYESDQRLQYSNQFTL